MINPSNPLIMNVTVGGCEMSFQFETIYCKEVIKYSVTAFEKANKICLFSMEKVKEKWKIINAPQIESKFLGMEDLFNDFLECCEPQ